MSASHSSRRVFVLVHGAWQGGWVFKRVADRLRSAGHEVYTPTLSGVGERTHLANHFPIDWSVHVQDVLHVIRYEQLTNVILCGHSYGGLVISGVADRIPEHISSLVYLDAMIPEQGRSVFGMNRAEGLVANLLKATADAGGQLVPPIPSAMFGTNRADQPIADKLYTPHPLSSFCEPVNLSGTYRNVRKKIYVRATGWSGYSSLGFQSYEAVARDTDWVKVDLPYGHELMLDAPNEVAQVLLSTL